LCSVGNESELAARGAGLIEERALVKAFKTGRPGFVAVHV
jgi:hypothetical protein